MCRICNIAQCTTKCSIRHVLLCTCGFRFCLLIYFRFNNVYVYVRIGCDAETVVPVIINTREKKREVRNVRNLTRTNSRYVADCHAISMNDRRRLKRIASGIYVIFLRKPVFVSLSRAYNAR